MSKYDNDLILRVLRKEKVERPPVWLMRQAGRILPQYRAVRSSLSGFKELVSTPDLVAEVTIQPVDELGVDAAIIFSDILVIPECMGLDYEMIEKKGPRFPEVIRDRSDVIKLLSGEDAAENLSYVYEGIKQTKKRLENRVPLIGFSGSPFTLLCYMVEGGGSKTFSKAKRLLYQDADLAHELLDKITETIIPYLKNKIAAGVDIIQLFDSWAGVLDKRTYKNFAVPYIKRIVDALPGNVPVIVFSKGAWFSLKQLETIDRAAFGIDWNISTDYARKMMPTRVLQGNLDPCALYGSDEIIEEATLRTIQGFGENHIVNLGHGVYPDTPLSGVKTFVRTVQNYRYESFG